MGHFEKPGGDVPAEAVEYVMETVRMMAAFTDGELDHAVEAGIMTPRMREICQMIRQDQQAASN